MAKTIVGNGSSAGGGEPVTNECSALLDHARTLRLTGRVGEAAELLASHLHTREEKLSARLALLHELAEQQLRAGKWDAAIRSIDDALELADDDESRWKLEERKAWALFRKGHLREARAAAESLNGSLTDAKSRAGLHNTLGGIAWQAGRCDDAFQHVSRAAAYFEEAGDRFGAATAHTNLGVLAYSQGRWSTAEQHFAAADQVRDDLGCIAGRAVNLLNLGLLRMAMGDHVQARENLEDAVRFARQAAEPYDESRAEIALAQLDLLQSRFDDASAHLESVLAARESINDDDVVQASWMKALVECDRGAVQQGMRLAEEARQIARGHNLLESEADCCRALASAYARSQQEEMASELLDEAIRLAAGDPYRRGLALLDKAVLRRDRENLDEATRLFEQLGARYDLRRAEDVRAQM